jgi:predicted outer membrane protein
LLVHSCGTVPHHTRAFTRSRGGSIQTSRFATALATIVLVSAPIAAGAQYARGNHTMSNGDVVTMNQKQVVDHMFVGDSLEVQMARIAESRSTNAAVKNFANVLITDHTKHLAALHKLAGKRDIGRATNPADSSGMRTARMLSLLEACDLARPTM